MKNTIKMILLSIYLIGCRKLLRNIHDTLRRRGGFPSAVVTFFRTFWILTVTTRNAIGFFFFNMTRVFLFYPLPTPIPSVSNFSTGNQSENTGNLITLRFSNVGQVGSNFDSFQKSVLELVGSFRKRDRYFPSQFFT